MKKKNPEPFSHQPFRSLEQLLRVQLKPAQRVSPKTVEPASKSDKELFQEAMKEVHEIREFRDLAVRKVSQTPNLRKPIPDDPMHELQEIVRGKGTVRLSDTQEYVEWVSPRYRREIAKELHSGRFAVQDYLDLHGYVLEDATAVFHDFMLEARRKGYHCIKIIHGRGLSSLNGPVLKRTVIALLTSRYRKHIIGFSTARQNDGGLGAVYVLLK